MKAIKTPDQFNDIDYNNHEAIPDSGEHSDAFISLCEAGFELVEGEKKYWQNSGDTLVLAIPDEVSSYHVLHLMNAMAILRPDEFDIDDLENVDGFSKIVRFWWD